MFSSAATTGAEAVFMPALHGLASRDWLRVLEAEAALCPPWLLEAWPRPLEDLMVTRAGLTCPVSGFTQ